MIRKALKASLLTLSACVAVRSAGAQNLGGCTGGVPDLAGTFVVAAPAGDPVIIDFSGCPGLSIYAVGSPGQLVSCPAKTVTVVAGAGGASFTIGGCVTGPLGAAGCASVSIAGGPLAPLRIGAFDLNCTGGVGAIDLSICISDFVLSPTEQRSDYDRSGLVGATDLSMLIGVFVTGGSSTTCSPRC